MARSSDREEDHLRRVREMIEQPARALEPNAMLRKAGESDQATTIDGAHRAARSRADVHHSAGAAAPLHRQLHLVRPWRSDALARLRPGRAVRRQFLHGLIFFIFGPVRSRQPDTPWTASSCADRAWRLGVPFPISIFVLMPLAYYPTFLRYHLPGTTDFNFLHFWWHTLSMGPWPSGPALVPVGVAGARRDRRAVWSIAPGSSPGARPADFCRAGGRRPLSGYF